MEVNYLVEARKKDGKLQIHTFESIIHALCEVGVKTNRDSFYKQIDREIINGIPVEVFINGTNTESSSITEQYSKVSNPFNDNSRTVTSHSSLT